MSPVYVYSVAAHSLALCSWWTMGVQGYSNGSNRVLVPAWQYLPIYERTVNVQASDRTAHKKVTAMVVGDEMRH